MSVSTQPSVNMFKNTAHAIKSRGGLLIEVNTLGEEIIVLHGVDLTQARDCVSTGCKWNCFGIGSLINIVCLKVIPQTLSGALKYEI